MEAKHLCELLTYRSKDIILVSAALQLAKNEIEPTGIQDLVREDAAGLDVLHGLKALATQRVQGRHCFQRIVTNFSVSQVLNMTYSVLLGQDALKVLKFLLLRGAEQFGLARRFISQNNLKQEETSPLLAQLFVQQVIKEEQQKAEIGMENLMRKGAWVTWGATDFATYANLCDDPVRLGHGLLAAVSGESAAVSTFGVSLSLGFWFFLACRHSCSFPCMCALSVLLHPTCISLRPTCVFLPSA